LGEEKAPWRRFFVEGPGEWGEVGGLEALLVALRGGQSILRKNPFNNNHLISATLRHTPKLTPKRTVLREEGLTITVKRWVAASNPCLAFRRSTATYYRNDVKTMT